MRSVVYALLPGTIAYIALFGWGVLFNILLTVCAALIFEGLMLLLRDRPLRAFLFDGSALVTALLLALALPPLAPWWLPVCGAFVAIVPAKHLYGGLGYNTFNPAMAAYAVLLISFPLEMTLWSAPLSQMQNPLSIMEAMRYVFSGVLPGNLEFDALSSATLLDHVRTESGLGRPLVEIKASPAFGYFAGTGYEWVSVGYLLGGLWLLYKKIISLHIPLAMLTSLGLLSTFFYLMDSSAHLSPLTHLFSGAAMLGAFFIATDPVTAPTTPRGRLIYAALIGSLIFVIRVWGAYPDGVAFAVLLAGLSVPLLDYYTVPKVYGARSNYEKP